MGRQTKFYMSLETRNKFLEYVFSQEYKIFSENYDSEKRIVQLEHNDCFSINSWCLLFYKDIYGELIFNESGRIDKLYSPVVEFIDTTIHAKNNYISGGRIWISNLNVFENEKSRESFLSDYNRLVRWIRKNVPRQEFFCGSGSSKGYIDETIKSEYEYKYRFV